MCGRYIRHSDKQRLAAHFHAHPFPADLPLPDADYNVAPTTYQPIIRQSRETGERELILARWGLVPFFSKDPKDVKGLSTINARSETITTAPTWREPFRKRRCLVPVSGFYEWAGRNGWLSTDEAAAMTDVPNIRQQGTRLGNWLTMEQGRELLAVPDRATLKGKRDYAMLALLIGCALRRQELATLAVEDLQMRENRWVIADLRGKGNRVRTVAVPLWVKNGLNAWQTAAGIEEGRLFRSVRKGGKVGESLSDWAVWSVVTEAAREIGIENFGAHDLRRTCAKLCRKAGGDLEQIKFLLGHSSIQTTERYLGSEQEIAVAVNDNLGL